LWTAEVGRLWFTDAGSICMWNVSISRAVGPSGEVSLRKFRAVDGITKICIAILPEVTEWPRLSQLLRRWASRSDAGFKPHDKLCKLDGL
jgi:hypothetical protein